MKNAQMLKKDHDAQVDDLLRIAVHVAKCSGWNYGLSKSIFATSFLFDFQVNWSIFLVSYFSQNQNKFTGPC